MSTTSSDINATLSRIQVELKAPKGQTNTFGKYQYRNCEDILEALKPIMGGATVRMSDSIHVAGERVYVQATVTFSVGAESIEATGFAREALTKKGMDESQITGAASSYARKYALNALFLIDDTKDADSQDNSGHVAAVFTVDQTAMNWIEACKKDPNTINQIKDPAYKDFIVKELLK